MYITDDTHGKLKGRLEIKLISVADGNPYTALTSGEWIEVGENSINNAAEDVVRGLLARDLENKMIETIAICDGGDLDITPLHNDTGARVAPDPIETEVRSLVESVPILLSSESGDDIIYTALAKPEQALSDDINEFGLLTRDGTLFAHFVTEEVAPGGRARKYPKKSWHYLAIRWTITYTNV